MRSRLGLMFAALMAAVCAVGMTDPGDGAAPAMPAHDVLRVVEANVIEVLDGDSLVVLLDGELRRLEILGADAPEWREQDAQPDLEAVVAKRFLTRLLLSERVAIHEPEPGATDQVGRRRGYVYRLPEGLSVDLEIVRQGYGRVSTRAGDAFEPALRWYETRAKELDRGVWGRSTEPAADEPGGVDAEAPAEPERVVEDPGGLPTEPERGGAEDEADRWVWITRSGSRYHREGCQHLKNSRSRVERDRLDPGMSPCKTCDPDG